MKLLKLQTLALLVMMSMPSFTALAQSSDEDSGPSIADVVKELINEAQVSYNAQQWFHLNKSYLNRNKNLKGAFTNNQIYMQMSRDYTSNPVINTYVRMNLLDFLDYDALRNMKEKKRWQLIQARPEYPRKPRPRNDEFGRMNTINGIRVASINQIRHAEEAWKRYHNSERMNRYRFEVEVVLAYRMKLIEMLPEDSFVQSYLRVVDLTERIENGQMEAISRKAEDGTYYKGTRPYFDRKGKHFNAEKLFSSMISANDLNPKTLRVLERAVGQLSRAQGVTYIKPHRKKPGDEWRSGRHVVHFDKPEYITETFKLALMKYADTQERKRAVRNNR